MDSVRALCIYLNMCSCGIQIEIWIGLPSEPPPPSPGGAARTNATKRYRQALRTVLVTLVLPQTLCLPMVRYLPTLLYLSLPYCSLVPTIHPRCRCAFRPSNNVLESLRSPTSPA